MKKFLLLVSLLLMTAVCIPAIAYAQDVGGDVVTAFELSTFTGIVAIVSFLVTQLAKFVPVIDSKTILKILVSVVTGIAVSLIAWKLSLAEFLANLAIWQTLIYGLLAGLSACGFYDLIKNFGKLFGFKTE